MHEKENQQSSLWKGIWLVNVREKFLKRFKAIVKMYCRVACEQVRQQWARHDEADGNSEIRFTVEDAEAVVTAAIIATGQKAWLLEYGKGSKMEQSTAENPFLEEYLSGEVTGGDGESLFNPRRLDRDLAVLGRPAGAYLDLDDNIHTSNGFLEGWQLEELGGRLGDFNIDVFPPRKIIKNILFGQNNDGLIAEINEEIFKAKEDIIFEIMSKFPKKIVISRW